MAPGWPAAMSMVMAGAICIFAAWMGRTSSIAIWAIGSSRLSPKPLVSPAQISMRPERSLRALLALADWEYTNRFDFKFIMDDTGGTFLREENGEPDVLFRNDGKGNFTPASWTDGTFRDEKGKALAQPPFDWGLSVMFHDLNGDGTPDLYICNDFKSSDRLWL